MAFHMEKPRLRLSLDPKERWPDKLYDVANDGYLLKWHPAGNSVIVEEAGFEEKVMHCYPGFLQISLFLNFRRLFREYGFDWKTIDEGTFEFSHPCFVRGQRELLDEIKTRRKSFSKVGQGKDIFKPPSLTASPSKKYCTRSSVKPKQAPSEKEPEEANDKAGCNYTPIKRTEETTQREVNTKAQILLNPERGICTEATKMNAADVMAHYAVNEMNLDEFALWAEKYSFNSDNHKYKPNDNLYHCRPTSSDDNNLIYGHMGLSRNKNTQLLSTIEHTGLYDRVSGYRYEMDAPCGQCKCCQIYILANST